MIDYLKGLNDRQREVVTDIDHPILVLAGAGSGKTRCIIYRAAYLIKEKQVPPWQILIVTFTNKAARELQTRLELLLNIPVRSLWVGTFHSICLRILRFESSQLPYNANFSIYGTDEQKSVLKKIYKAHGFDQQKYPLNRVLGRIGRYKNRLMLPEDIDKEEYESSAFLSGLVGIYHHYQQALLMNQAMDFDDILLYTARLLRDSDELRAKYQDIFQYIMIDEYQDTNKAQFEIIHQLALQHQRVCVVGDDDQAIYSFRGATLRNILEFERDYKEVRAIRLEQNYRSTTAILNLANQVISHNKNRHSKELWSELGEGIKPLLRVYQDANGEAEQIACEIQGFWDDGYDLRDITILYRTNAQSRLFEHALMQKKIPYSIVGSLQFYQRKEIKDLIAYLNSLSNPSDNESLLRIINEPARGIGQTTVSRLLNFAVKTHISLYQTVLNPSAVPQLKSTAIKRVSEFAKMMQAWSQAAKNQPVADLVKDIVEELGLVSLYRKSSDPKDITRAENLIEFVASVNEFAERFALENEKAALLQDFLPFIALQTDLDMVSEDLQSVRLMTLHNAKGLEFETVYIAGLENELLPHRMSMETREEIEEERRLFYVGITRAKRRLILSLALSRRLYDTYNITKPSMFLRGLSDDVLDAEDFDLQRPRSTYQKPKHKIRDSQKFFRIGQRVWHDEYQEGKVLSVNGIGQDAVVTVSFTCGKLIKIVGSYLRTEPESKLT
ncbi:MAG: 3'-5' exonuclease [Candidatus Cloacimonadaceae bacterium]|jgi:DNA helicase-2/ATP-dependent DNA helicase PcrA|nr:UvrD-helicase domain-containing protein [Candidatus Cloacimonadota bacterium]MCB5255609.1 UvrD-helicase domain-containing protein [Candidatus Cloacimonadota bacterium]MCK9177437.1 UvrD-helicase domain-containing protein [Candidatus Cloacimonadota bacterium]MCK9243256.1 UvrD-helicase domain-containing protein [Candidatus Cloacimonadota bacterium]MDY0126716.1 3'-5' exonuclease [Candidatus Cloacimonadaceae bacterium]